MTMLAKLGSLNLFARCTMRLLPRHSEEPDVPRPPDSRRAALLGLLFTLLLIIGSVVLIHVLGRAARLQDCVMSGRTNCAPIHPESSAVP